MQNFQHYCTTITKVMFDYIFCSSTFQTLHAPVLFILFALVQEVAYVFNGEI